MCTSNAHSRFLLMSSTRMPSWLKFYGCTNQQAVGNYQPLNSAQTLRGTVIMYCCCRVMVQPSYYTSIKRRCSFIICNVLFSFALRLDCIWWFIYLWLPKGADWMRVLPCLLLLKDTLIHICCPDSWCSGIHPLPSSCWHTRSLW